MLTLLLVLPPVGALAHGSVTADADLCIIRIGFYTAHFKVYQAARSGHREFCEDLPVRGETLFVMEYLHQSLSEVPLEFRILRNPTGLGRFTRLEDLPQDAAALAGLTVLQQRVEQAPDVLTVRHAFAEAGAYVGVVKARDPNTGQEYVAVFPFEVEGSLLGWVPLSLLAALVLAQCGFWWSRGRLHLRPRAPQAAVVVLLAASLLPPPGLEAAEAVLDSAWQDSRSGHYRVLIEPDLQPLPLNRMHGWTLTLQDADGHPVNAARLQLKGGMPAHNHGLPTAPELSPLPEPGRYRVEGLRFHMPGEWELQLQIAQDGREDSVFLTVQL